MFTGLSVEASANKFETDGSILNLSLAFSPQAIIGGSTAYKRFARYLIGRVLGFQVTLLPYR
jgi:hypothetical protein